jgi:HD-GYP domain-containing protein (c-di-GMP phosphodiesterase class II)
MQSTGTVPGRQAQDVRAFPVSIDSLDPAVLKMDLYLKTGGPNSFVLYRSVGVPFTADDQQRLLDQGLRFLYVPFSQHAAYRDVLLDHLEKKYHDPAESRAERVRAVRSACVKMIQDVLLFPSQPELVDAVADISRRFALWSSQNHDEFSYLLDMSAHDFYTVTHMVNVGVGCGLLIKELRPGTTELHAPIIQGGLLHDIGKRQVSEEILNKSGQLEPDEWELVRRHPEAAYNELRAIPGISRTVLEMARNHHERPDGAGYPRGLAGHDLGFAGRVCAVVDVYDAISSSRSYRPAMPPADVLRTMQSGSGTQFDPEILEAWTDEVTRLVQQDPARAPAPTGARQAPAHTAMPEDAVRELAQASQSRQESDAIWGDERRRYPRFPCRTTVCATFVRQGKRGQAKPSERVPVELVDVSRGGLQLRTPWPLSINDLIEIELPAQNGAVTRRRAQVVRVRQCYESGWLSGLCFVSRVQPLHGQGNT